MSWPLASFLLVLGVLLVGWLAYERARPSPRMVAVVATLAAVAALGRDAFVALPDVKPITAMTLVVGYALGPLPGFTVGALGMLASNIMLGQGPYTPWQMAAWGMVGLAGAALGRLTGRRLGRVGLAAACAVAAIAAKEIMNVYTWTIGASHTPAAFLATASGALPFDVTDTVASLLFGLAFGPELARLLARMRARMDVSWELRADAVEPAEEPLAPAGGLRSLPRAGPLAAILLVGTLLGGARAASAAPSAPHSLTRTERPRRLHARTPSSPSSPAPRTPTGASAARAGSRAASSSPGGRRWGSPPRDATRRAYAPTGTRCSTRYAAKHRLCRASATQSARSSPRARAAPRPTPSPAATSSPKCSPRACATARSALRST